MNKEQEGPPNRELYALLHLSPEASDEEIRKAYRQWAQVYHPDKYQAPHVCIRIPFFFILAFVIELLILFLSKSSFYWVSAVLLCIFFFWDSLCDLSDGTAIASILCLEGFARLMCCGSIEYIVFYRSILV